MKKDARIPYLSTSLICSCILFLLFLLWWANEDIGAAPVDEYALKAAFVLNFNRFAQWPESSFDGGNDPFRLCVVGGETVEHAFRVIDGKEVGARQLHVYFARGVADVQRCNTVFIAKDTDRSTVLRIFAAVKDRPILTVGETEEFIRLGGMINFFTEEGRLRFVINPEKSRQQRIKLSSRLLSLAVIVEEMR